MKKLLILVKTIDGGTGTQLKYILKIKQIIKEELTVSAVALERPIFMQQSDESFQFLKSRDYSLQRYSFSIKNIINFIKEFSWVTNKIRRENPDLVMSMDINCNIYSGLYKLLYRKNHRTIFITTSDLKGNLVQRSTKILGRILKGVINYFYNKSDLIICVSKTLSQSLKTDFEIKARIVTIYNGLDSIISTERDKPTDSNIILMVSRLDKQKDHLTLIKAFSLFEKEVENTQLWLIGDGPIKNELQAFVDANDLNKKVFLYGWQNNLKQYFLNSDVFVLSSIREGMPYALIEAMRYGLPVVCTDTPFGPAEILEEGKYGCLIPMRDHIGLYRSLKNLLTERKTYSKYSRLALERSKLFSAEKMINDYINEIRNLLSTT